MPHISLRSQMGVLVGLIALCNGVSGQSPFFPKPQVSNSVAILGSVIGQVRLNESAEANSHMRIQANDLLSLSSDTSLEIIYFREGRREFWSGPASFRAGQSESNIIKGQPSRIGIADTRIVQKLGQIPKLLNDMRMSRLAGTRLYYKLPPQKPKTAEEAKAMEARRSEEARNLQNERKKKLDDFNDFRQTYKTIRMEADADDVVPEIYLFSEVLVRCNPHVEEYCFSTLYELSSGISSREQETLVRYWLIEIRLAASSDPRVRR